MTPDRPLWFLPAQTHLPVRSDAKAAPKDVTHWCREGDREWTRAGDQAEPVPTGSFVGWAELLGDLADEE